MLDDIHLAEEASVAALAFVGRELRNVPALLLATYRDVEVRRRHPLANTLGELARARRAERIKLYGLSGEEVPDLMVQVGVGGSGDVAPNLRLR